MKLTMAACVAAVLFTAMPAMASQKQQPAAAAAAPAGPHPKTQKELEALQKVQTATDPDSQLAAISNVLENFTDTDYKPMLISMAMQAAQQKDDPAVVATWTDRALQENPNDIEAHVVIAETTARHTRENDLDKADSIKKIKEHANKALDLLKSATKAPAGFPEAQWPAAKLQLTGQAYDALGQAAAVDKNYAEAVNEYKLGVAADPTASVAKARLARAYLQNKDYDNCISTADSVINDANAQATVKSFAQSQKDAAVKMKGASAPK